MTFSNRLILAATVLSTLAACDGRRDSRSRDGDDASFRVESVSLNAKSVLSSDNDTASNKTAYQLKACFTDSISRSSIAQTEFAVSDGVTEKTAVTEQDGCMMWMETHEFSSAASERVIRVKRHFIGKKGFKGTVTVTMAFNPGLDGGSWYDLRKFPDLPGLEAFEENLAFEAPIVSKLTGQSDEGLAVPFVGAAEFTWLNMDTENTKVNRLLTLKTAQKYRLKIEPKLIVNNLRGEQVTVSLKGGAFNVKIAVVRQDSYFGKTVKVSDLIASYEGQIAIRKDGLVYKEISLQIHDPAGALNRNVMYVTLEPVGAAKSLVRTATYKGEVGALGGASFAVPVIADESSSRDDTQLVDQILEASNRSTPSAVQVFESALNLKNEGTDAAILALGPDSRNRQQQGMINYFRQIGAFCDRLYSADQKITYRRFFGLLSDGQTDALAACKNKPWDYISVKDANVVDEITGAAKYVHQQNAQQVITISETSVVAISADTALGIDFSAKAGLSLDVPTGPLKDFVKIGFGADFYAVSSNKKVTSDGRSAAVARAATITVERATFEIPATVRHCVLVASTHPDAKPGFFACEAEAKQQTITERYYLLNRAEAPSGFVATNLEDIRNWRFTIRGDEVYSNFVSMVTKQNVLLSFTKIITPPTFDDALLPNLKVNQVFPGVVSAGSIAR